MKRGNGWLPFQIAHRPPLTIERLKQSEPGLTDEEYERLAHRENTALTFKNNIYQVTKTEMPGEGPDAVKMVWLSIKRVDKRHIHDWRDLQRIKNELVGPECEAVEIYPAESRLVDEANQYHLWVFKDPGFSLGLGFNKRRVGDWDYAQKVGARQRPLPDWMKKNQG